MLNKLNTAHADQKIYFRDQLDLVGDEWADVSYRYDECASISNGICTIYFGMMDLSYEYPYICAAIEDNGHEDLGSFDTIKTAVEYCEKRQFNQ